MTFPLVCGRNKKLTTSDFAYGEYLQSVLSPGTSLLVSRVCRECEIGETVKFKEVVDGKALCTTDRKWHLFFLEDGSNTPFRGWQNGEDRLLYA